jgi:NAD(P)-dependent dehydrogenase (short-subunit alcohol dehydrogenase family)
MPHCASPSPLNGERAGVRSEPFAAQENFKPSFCMKGRCGAHTSLACDGRYEHRPAGLCHSPRFSAGLVIHESASIFPAMARAFITGANRGIGLALARALVERDIFVFAGARRPEEARELIQLQQASPAALQIVPLDVTRADSVQRAVQKIKSITDSLDILVNNAAVFLEESGAKLAGLEVDLFDQTFSVNVTGVARVTQAFLPLLLRSASPRIVNISSGAGSIGDKSDHHYYGYGASKAALNHFTVGLAHELRPNGVIVVALSPGWVRTDMGGAGAELAPEDSAAAIADTIRKLKPGDSGQFLDRFGRHDQYEW